MTSTRNLWFMIVLLLLVIAAMLFKFVLAGNTSAGDMHDTRTKIHLTIQERTAVLAEMRQMLEATQAIVASLAEKDMSGVVQAAEKVGMQATSTMDMRLMAKLPFAFKKMGMGTHQAFDEIAHMAKQGKSAQSIQRQLADTMNNCIACHASFQLPSKLAMQ